MKQIIALLAIYSSLLSGCGPSQESGAGGLLSDADKNIILTGHDAIEFVTALRDAGVPHRLSDNNKAYVFATKVTCKGDIPASCQISQFDGDSVVPPAISQRMSNALQSVVSAKSFSILNPRCVYTLPQAGEGRYS